MSERGKGTAGLLRDVMTIDLSFVRRFPGECCEEVSRGGEAQPCDKPAVAVRLYDQDHAYPVCKYHTRGQMLPLAKLIEEASR